MPVRDIILRFMGETGAIGSRVFRGIGNPTGQSVPARLDIDLFLDGDTGDIWFKSALPDTWTFFSNIEGPPIDIATDPNFVEVSAGPTDAGKAIKLNGAGKADGSFLPASTAGISTLRTLVPLTVFVPKPLKGSEWHMHGAFRLIMEAQALDPGNSIVGQCGRSRIMFLVKAGVDVVGSINVLGTIVDRNTGASTPAFTEQVAVNGLTIDNSAINGDGILNHDVVGGYATDNWFDGGLVISTTDLDISDLDIYQVSYNQFNDSPDILVTTIDMRILAQDAAAVGHAHAYSVIETDGKFDVQLIADLHLPPGAVSPDGFYNLRVGGLQLPLNGQTDGVFVDAFFGGAGQDSLVESFNILIWATIGQEVQFTPVLVDWRDVSDPTVRFGAAAYLDFALSYNVVPILLTEEMDFTIENLVIDKGILLAIKHSGGPWPFKPNGVDFPLLGEANEEEGVLLTQSLHDGSLQISNVRPPEAVQP